MVCPEGSTWTVAQPAVQRRLQSCSGKCLSWQSHSATNQAPHPVLQAPEPLYLAAQLVRDTSLPRQQLPEFSYRRSHGAGGGPGAPAGGSPGAHLPDADAFLPLPAGRSLRTDAVDEIGCAAVRALLQSDVADAFDDVPGRLRRVACTFDRPLGAPPPTDMGRRIRRRSCNEAALRCGMLSLVAC
jgi:hypothetical protein